MNKTKDNCGIYVHIPFCKARCGYCAFSSCTDLSLCDRYFQTLVSEIENARVPENVRIKTMFWGGGTPSCVPTGHLRKLFEALRAKFDLSELTEFTVECNPESTTMELTAELVSFGVNRISFGLQSVNDATLRAIGRLHNYEQFERALEIARSCGIENVNADLILGLPETEENFLRSVRVVSQLDLQHVSLYALELHEENAAFKRLCEKCAHTEDTLANMYDVAREILQGVGFGRYEISNFAKRGFECKHNLQYWTEGRYFGFGAAASGFVGNVRYGNTFDVRKYVDNSGDREYEDVIEKQEEKREYVMLGLRLQNGFDLQDFAARYNADFFTEFPAARSLMQRGFLCESGGRIVVPDDKFYVLNSILVELLPD